MERTANTTNIQATIDVRRLASIAVWAYKEGLQFGSRSELVRISVSMFYQILLLEKKTEAIQSADEAVEILHKLGLPVKARPNRQQAFMLSTKGEIDRVVSIAKMAEEAEKYLDMDLPPERMKDGSFDKDEFRKLMEEDEDETTAD